MMIKKAPHILIVTPAYPPFPGGGERYVGALAQGLAQLGHPLTILTTQAQLEQDFWHGSQSQQLAVTQQDNIKIIRCPVPRWHGGRNALLACRKGIVLASIWPWNQTTVLQHMAQHIPPISALNEAFDHIENIDIVHGFNISWEHLLVAGYDYAQRHQLPWVITPFAHLGSKKRDRVALNSTMDHQKALMGQADALLALTQVEIDGLHNWGVAPRKTAVIGGGIDPVPDTYPTPQAILDKYALTTPIALMVGRMSYDKGVIHAAQATLKLATQGIPITLALMGQSTPEFDRFYAQLNAQEQQQIRPLGLLSEADKHALLEAATLLLLPSRSDSFGIVMLEAWAHGTPVIAANAGGIPAVVDDGENGLLVPFGDVAALVEKLQELLGDEGLRERLGKNGRLKLQTHYVWEKVAQQVTNHYTSLLAQ